MYRSDNAVVKAVDFSSGDDSDDDSASNNTSSDEVESVVSRRRSSNLASLQAGNPQRRECPIF